jgi:hypothetical protein
MHMSDRVITLAIFENPMDVQYNLLKGMLEEANIKFSVVNENFRSVEPFTISPSNISIEIRVLESDLEQAQEILESIE